MADEISVDESRTIMTLATQWIMDLEERRGAAKTIVAVANKNARVIFAMLKKDTEFRAA